MGSRALRWCVGALVVGICGGAGLAAYVFAPTPAVQSIVASEVDLSALDAVPDRTWAALRGKRIYFGHQSVGKDIVSGLEEILRRMPRIGLQVRSSDDPQAFAAPGFVHGPVGRNRDPQSKLDAFASVLSGPHGEQIDWAMLKFCYADLAIGGDPDRLLADYGKTVETIAAARPQTRLVHATMPLTVAQTGPKARVKRLLGRAPGVENTPRTRYNEALLARFGSASVFDIAAVESTLPDRTQATVEAEGRRWPCLAGEWARDSGHLHAGGELVAARELLLFLAAQCDAASADGRGG